MMKKTLFIVLLLLISTMHLFAQNSTEDSLLTELKFTKQDTARVNILIDLYKSVKNVDTEKSYKYIEQALNLSKKCAYTIGIGKSNLNMGDVYYTKGDYEEAKKSYENALNIFKEINRKDWIVRSYLKLSWTSFKRGNFDRALDYCNYSIEKAKEINDKFLLVGIYIQIGNMNFYKGEYYDALKYYELSLKISEELDDDNDITISLLSLGNVYANLDNYAESIDYYQKALKKARLANDKFTIADCTNNIGLVYSIMNNQDKALEYILESSKLYKELGFENGLINSYINIGQVYFDIGKLNEAKLNYKEALQLAQQSNDKYNILIVYLNLGDIYFKESEYAESEKYYNNSLAISKELEDFHTEAVCYEKLAKIQQQRRNFTNAIQLAYKSLTIAKQIGVRSSEKDAYKLLSSSYEDLGNLSKALKFYKLYKVMQDSIFNQDNINKINELETRYQTEKKQQQIELQETKLAQQEAEIEQQKTLRNTLVGGIIAILAIAILAVYAYLMKRRSNKRIEAQKNEIECQKGIIEKKNTQILDSINYAKRIQESVFLTSSEIKHHFIDSFLMNLPKDIVSGDFVWFAEVNHHKVFAVVDCTGHGVPGAFMSLIGNSLLNEIVKEKGIVDPAEILNALHLGVLGVLRQDSGQSKSNDGMDMVICVYDYSRKELKFSGARNFMYVKNGSELVALDGDPYSIGEIPFSKKLKVNFNTQTIKIKDDTKIYLMTDGYMDQFGGKDGKKFNQLPFEKMLNEISGLPMVEQKDRFYKAFSDWKGDNRQIDDVMLLGINLS